MPQSQASALRDVVRATYRRAGLDKSETELQALLPTVRPLIDFDPRQAREADIVGLLGKLSLQDASLPAAPGPVSLIRTLSKEPLAAYGGTAPDITTKSVTELAALLANGTRPAVEGLIAEAEAAGGRIATGGERPHNRSFSRRQPSSPTFREPRAS